MTDMGQIFNGPASPDKNRQLSQSGIADAKKYEGMDYINQIAEGVPVEHPTLAGNPEDKDFKGGKK